MNLGIAIRDFRKAREISQVELAKRAGITQTSLSKIENGSTPHQGHLEKIAKALRMPLDMFYIYSLEESDFRGREKQYRDQFHVIQTLIMALL